MTTTTPDALALLRAAEHSPDCDTTRLALDGGEEAFPPASAWRTYPTPDAAKDALGAAIADVLRALVPP